MKDNNGMESISKVLVVALIGIMIGSSFVVAMNGIGMDKGDNVLNKNAEEGLVACWHFDENTGNITYDSSGNNNNGTIYGASWTTGVSGSALSFDGVNDYVNVPDSASLDITEAITLEAWVKPGFNFTNETLYGKYEVILNKEDGTGDGYQLFYLSGYIYLNLGDGTWHAVTTPIDLYADNWYHIVGTYDGSNMKLFINGQQVANETWGGTISLTSNDLWIGKNYWNDNIYFNGTIDEVSIYNRALSANEIQAHYEQYAGGAGLPDLTLTSDDISFSNSNPNVNETITVNATVHNAGQTYPSWEVKTEMNDSEFNTSTGELSGWTLTENYAKNCASITNGTLQLNCTGENKHWFYQNFDNNLSNSVGTTFEVREKVISTDNSSTAPITHNIKDGKRTFVIGLWADGVYLNNINEIYEMNTTYTYHTYRMVVKGDTSKLYVDGVLRVTSNTPHSDTTYKVVEFGDTTDQLNFDFVTEIDYIYYTTKGAFAPEVAVNFYDGNPATDGTLIGTDTVSVGTWTGNEYSVDSNTFALWHMNENTGGTIYDETTNNNDGTVNGATWADGKFDSALSFGNTGLVYQIPASFDDSVTNDITVEAWVYWGGPHPETYSPNSYIFDARDLESTAGGFILYLNETGKLHFALNYGSGGVSSPYQTVYSSTSVQIDQWTHVAGVLDYTNGKLKVFINGVEDGSTDASSPYYDFGGSHYNAAIGNNRYAPGDSQWTPFNGTIDEVRISNAARSFNTAIASINWTPTTAGNHTIYVVADPDNLIAESDETNNEAWKNITVQTVANQPPVVNITYPEEGQNVNGTVTITGNAYDPDNTQSGLVGCWHFDENNGTTAYDSSGNGNDGTIYGATWTNGVSGSALSFDGVNDYVSISNTPTLSSLTLEGWINLSNTTGINQFIEFNGDYPYIETETGTSKIVFGLTDINNAQYLTTSQSISLNTWHHVVGTYDGNVQKLYIDGNLVDSIVWSGTPSNGLGCTIGRDYEWASQYWTGTIDEVSIYNRALNASEIQAHYEEYALGLVACWHFDENTGTTAYDSSGNNNDGTVYGATWTTGVSGSALSFDGVNDYVDVGTMGDFGSTLDGDKTYELWLKTTSTAKRALFGTYNDGFNTQVLLELNTEAYSQVPGKIGFDLRDDGHSDSRHLQFFTSTAYNFYDGNWHHLVVITKPGTNTAEVYWDGKNQSIMYTYQNILGPFSNFQYIMVLGAANTRGLIDNYFNGTIDEVRIYNKALNASEIQAHYEGSNPAIQKVEIKIDDGDWEVTSGTTSWSFDWDTTTVSNGWHTIYARAFDGVDYSEIKSVSVYVDNAVVNQPPVVNIIYPVQNQTVSSIVNVTGNASDPEGLYEVEVKIDNGDWQLVAWCNSSYYFYWEYEWDTTTVDNGWHTIYARAFDGIDYSEIKSVSVYVDNAVPQGTLSGYVLENATFNPIQNALVNISYHETYQNTYTDETGYYYIDNIPTCECVKNVTVTKEGYVTKTKETAISEGTWLNFTLEPTPVNQAPIVSITYPEEGQTVTETVTITGAASDPDETKASPPPEGTSVQKVEVKIDDGNWQIASGTTSWSFNWNTTTVSNGWHTIYAMAYDGIGYSEIKSVSVYVDNIVQDTEKPQISDVQANPASQVQGGWVNITCTVTDNVEVETVIINIWAPDYTEEHLLMTRVEGTDNYYYNAIYTVIGDYNYTIYANDTSGNWNSSEIYQFIIQEENQPPTAVTLYDPTGITTNSMTLTWTQNTDDDFAKYEIYQSVSAGVLGALIHTITEQTTTSYTVTGLTQDTTYYFTVRVVDTGELDSYSNQVSDKTLKENQPPTVTIDSITPNPAIFGESVTFTGHGTDDDGSIEAYNWYSSIDGQLNTSASFSTSTLSVGTHTIYFKVQDDDGEWSDEVTETLVINLNVPPTVEIIYPEDNQTVNGVVTITGTASDSDGTVQIVEIKIDTGVWETANSTTSWCFVWNTTTFSDGLHTIYARAFDGFNYSDIRSVQVNVSNIVNQPPVAEFTVYQGIDVADGEYVNVTLRVSGEKYRWVNLTVYADDAEVGFISLERTPGAPETDYRIITIDSSKLYTIIINYTADKKGGNPVWLDIDYREITYEEHMVFHETSIEEFNLTMILDTMVRSARMVRFDVPLDICYDPDGEIVNYTWDFGDGCYGYEPVMVHVYDDYGTYTVSLLVMDNSGDTGMVSKEVSVSDVTGDYAACKGQFGVELDCPADLLITDTYLAVVDPVNSTVGWLGGVWVNNIPNSSMILFGDIEIYFIPRDADYAYRVSGTDNGNYVFSVFDPGEYSPGEYGPGEYGPGEYGGKVYSLNSTATGSMTDDLYVKNGSVTVSSNTDKYYSLYIKHNGEIFSLKEVHITDGVIHNYTVTDWSALSSTDTPSVKLEMYNGSILEAVQELCSGLLGHDLLKPDLTIVDVTIVGSLREGELVSFSVQILNKAVVTHTSLGVAKDVCIRLYVDDEYVGSSSHISLIYSNHTAYTVVQWRVKPGTHTLRFEVYTEEDVDSSNNEYIMNVDVEGKKPILAITPETAAVIATAGIGAGLVLFALAGTEIGKYKMFTFLAPLYLKTKKEEVLDNFIRGQVYGYVKANPGVHYNLIKTELNLKNGSVTYHLNMLEKQGYVKSQFDGIYRRFYPKGMKIPTMDITGLSKMQLSIINKILEKPDTTQNEIAKSVGESKQVVNYHLKVLSKAGVVRLRREGRKTRCYVTDEFQKYVRVNNGSTIG